MRNLYEQVHKQLHPPIRSADTKSSRIGRAHATSFDVGQIYEQILWRVQENPFPFPSPPSLPEHTVTINYTGSGFSAITRVSDVGAPLRETNAIGGASFGAHECPIGRLHYYPIKLLQRRWTFYSPLRACEEHARARENSQARQRITDSQTRDYYAMHERRIPG